MSAPYEIGRNILIQTVTKILTGRLETVTTGELVITSAAWIADTGRYTNAVATGIFSEVEVYPKDAKVIVNRASIIDAMHANWELPSSQK